MKKIVVSVEGWQIFFVWWVVIISYSSIPNDQGIWKSALSILLAVGVFGWFMLSGTALNDNLPEDEQKSDVPFIICCFYGVLAVAASSVLKDVYIDPILGLSFAFLFVASFFYIIYFISTAFAINQDYSENKKLRVEIIFLLFIAFVFGILVIQSHIRRFFNQSGNQ
ncbi:hypothetical protein [Dawidia soli]|uniref:Uncharacterized protein n=1 Tax=Dawidia soli TaxID=2782352 RepID=A0AAP2DE03_9BACT|nr:hypothetical protein [Dawidia soli]MBT1689005.1 hypothetical protein [Dawidia soli]